MVQELTKRYRKQVLGETCLVTAPQEFWELTLMAELKIQPNEWDLLSVDNQAKIMARQYLRNMVDVLDAHYRAQDENAKKNRSKQSDDG